MTNNGSSLTIGMNCTHVKISCLALTILSFSVTISFAQNTFNSRLFYSKPPLYNSKSKVTSLKLSGFDVSVALPVDNRSKFYGETVYKKIKTHALEEFFQSPAMNEIQNKILSDMKKFGLNHTSHNKLIISPCVEVFYPKVSGFVMAKSFAKVRLGMTATLNDSLLINNTYESFYITNETDKEFEGNLLMTEEEGTNVTIGMTLRKALDQFYSDLNDGLHPGDKQVITGKVINSKTGVGVSAKILFESDKSYSAISTTQGKYRLVIPPGKNYNIQVQAPDFVNLSEHLDNPTSQSKPVTMYFRLQPIEVGAVVNLKSVLFYMGTTNLLEESYPELNVVVTFLKSNPNIKIELDGYTDNRGDVKKDLLLSQQRVEKIKSYLASKGISSRRILGKGFGSSKPIATNENEEGRKLNRRVEFTILKN